MGVSSTANRIAYAGNNATTSFAFPYYFFATTDLSVYIYDTVTGAITHKTLGTHYTVTGTPNYQGVYANGGAIVMGVAPTSTQMIVTIRNPPETQTYNILENGVISSAALVQQMDYLTLLVQRLEDQVSRAILLPDGLVATFDPTLPSTAALPATAQAVLAVNATNNGLAFGPVIPDLAAIVAAVNADAAAAAASAAAASSSAGAASTSETNALSYKNAAGISAAAAAASAASISGSVAAAAASAAAALVSEGNASTSETNAAASAAAALVSKNAAAVSAGNASTSETNAGVSAAAALVSKNAAAVSAGNALTSETNAAASAAAAAISAASIATPETQMNIADNQSAPANVTGLTVDASLYIYAKMFYSMYRTDGVNPARIETGYIHLEWDPQALIWYVADRMGSGDALGMGPDSFTVTTTGTIAQVQYVSDNMGSTIGKLRWKNEQKMGVYA